MPTAAKKTSTRKSSRPSAPTGELTWSGCLDLERAAALTAEIRQAIASSDTITLTLRDVESADLSFVQILLAASHTTHKAGKTLRVVDQTDSIEALCQEAGFGPTYQRLTATEVAR